MRLNPILILIGLGGCEPAEPPLAGNPPPPVDPGAITEAAADAKGPLNARSANHGKIYANKNGSCYVRIPATRQLPPGAMGPTSVIPCPPSMTHPSFAECSDGTLSRTDRGDCECRPFAGNPPPPPKPIDCPS